MMIQLRVFFILELHTFIHERLVGMEGCAKLAPGNKKQLSGKFVQNLPDSYVWPKKAQVKL